MATNLPQRIVLTGGPGAGKTVISREIARRHPERFLAVPESATAVYAALQTRRDRLDDAGRRDTQRRIYRQQLDQEAAWAARAAPGQALLLDRGTLDGSTYWPDGVDDYWARMATTYAAELARYDAVVWLETCAALGLYDGGASNACRVEDAPAAVASGRALHDLWSPHPRFFHVAAHHDLALKLQAVEQIVLSLTDNS